MNVGLKLGTAVRLEVPLLPPMRPLGRSGDFGELGEFFDSLWRPHLYTWRPRSPSIRYAGLSGSMFVPDTFWLRATVLELRGP